MSDESGILWRYSLVVIGTMEWRTQHPLIYQRFGLLTEEETKEAIPTADINPLNSRFAIPAFDVYCEHAKWQITTSSRENWQRITTIAHKLFDVELKHTQIGAYGMNTHAYVHGNAKNTHPFALAIGKAVGFPIAGEGAVQFQIKDETQSGSRSFGAIPLTQETLLTHNTHHAAPSGGDGPTEFDLAALLEKDATKDWQAGIEFITEFVARFSGVRHGADAAAENKC